jgi:MFS family permease
MKGRIDSATRASSHARALQVSRLLSRLRLAADDPFRDADVRLLFGAQAVSILGSQVSHIAFPLIAVDVIQASNGSIVLLEAAFLMPFVLLSLPVGALLDRRARRPVMVLMDLLRTAALLIVPLSFVMDALTMPVLYAVLFIIGAGTLIYDVANQSYLPALLRGPRLAEANSRIMVIDSGASVAGPPIAGVIIGRLGGPLAILLDSLSYLISALMLRKIKHLEVPPVVSEGAAPSRLRDEIRQGLHWVLTHPHLRGNALAALLFNFFGAIANGAVLIAYGRRELLLPAELLGLILGAGVLGLLIGSLTARRIAERIGVGRSIILGGFLLPSMPLGFALLDVSMGVIVLALFSVLFQVVAFFGAALFHTNQVTYRQLVTPKALLGRMNASMKWLMLIGMPLGAVVGSIIAEQYGLQAALYASAIGIIVGPIPLFFSGIASVVRQPEHSEE